MKQVYDAVLELYCATPRRSHVILSGESSHNSQKTHVCVNEEAVLYIWL